jgi:hypothetical protein
MFKVKVSDEFCIKVINSQRIKIKKCCFYFLFMLYNDTYLSIKLEPTRRFNWKISLKSFPRGLYPRYS